jgi:hypothetical protein
VIQQIWANIASTGIQTAAGWTTVTSGKKKLKKHPLDQRRILFTRNSLSHTCDPRNIMFEINKALAYAKADITIRLIRLTYIGKRDLSAVTSENVRAEDLLEYTPALIPVVQKLDPAVVDIEKTERWCKLRVYGVASDRYCHRLEPGCPQAAA